MATPADVRTIFEARLKEATLNPTELFHPLDLERSKDDKYLKRVLIHCEKDAKSASDMLWDICTWRKSNAVNDINENTIRLDYVKEGMFFPRGRDVDGSLMLILKSKMHVKGQKSFEDLKKIMIYWFDRLEREENGNKITMFFDMDGAGLSNMDMELIKYLISLFKLYYPNFLNYIVIFNMAWVLNAAFKVVKSLLPAKAIERMKFANKDTLKDIVAPEQALKCWGGKDDYVFEFVPENLSVSEHTPKKVTFAEQGDNQHSPGEMLRRNPNDNITFKSENDEVSGQFTITNMDESTISFKIRTTSPEKFRVRPSSGVLASGASQTVLIVVQAGFQLRTVTKDRFLVISVQIPKMDMTPKELADVWQNSTGSKQDEYRLKCNFPESELAINGNIVSSGNKIPEKPENLTNVLTNLQNNYEVLHNQVHTLKIFQLMTLVMTGVAVFLGYLIYKNTSGSDGYCERM
ncbi:Motile sperm domain-containing protein [Operophtera brumata]|uniref:Motile sperm domain-containing protein n=1 Tax=Operophtera brumata TaxID=104452 RepID=A0A0L7L2G7_OPEBR|nr:Motile sperm domain-containing protein [Operophtera brumata]